MYPNDQPNFPTLTAADHPKAEHLNAPNRVIEAICAELGTNPRAISPIAPKQNPQNVARYLDMLAMTVKTMTGAANWYNAAVPLRFILNGSGNGTTIPASTTNYAYPWYRGMTATENLTQIPVAYAGSVLNFRAQILTNQPATGSLVFTVRKNGVDTLATFTMAAGTGGGLIAGVTATVAFAQGNLLSVKIVNNATSASAQIANWSLEYDQNG